MDWIYLFRGIAEPIATGVKKESVYVVAKTEKEAITKAVKCVPGNYEVAKMEKIAELYDFGTDVYTPENM